METGLKGPLGLWVRSTHRAYCNARREVDKRERNGGRSCRERERMERFFGNAYRGDPGVPHSGAERFVNIWIGSLAFSVITAFHPYTWQLCNEYNWHDRAMLFEQYHWKKALAKGQPYKFKWNEKRKELRTAYYYNWPIFFP